MSRLRLTGNHAQAAVTITVAVAFALATYLANRASDEWSQSVTTELRWSAGLIEDARYLYVDEAPLAYEYITSQERADALVAEASGADMAEAGAALIEADLIRKSVEIRRADLLASGDSLLDEEYQVGDYFHVGKRLEVLREQHAIPADAGAGSARADTYRTLALAVALIPVPVAAGYLFVFVWRRQQAMRGTHEDVALIPDPREAKVRRGTAVVALAAWVLLVLVPPLQLFHSTRSAEASSEAARGAVVVMREVTVGNLAASFQVQVHNRSVTLQGMAQRRAIAYDNLPAGATPGQGAIVRADDTMASRYEELASATIKSATDAPGLGAPTLEALEAGPARWAEVLQVQNRRAEASARASARNNAMTLALVLAGIATTLAALARTDKQSFSLPIMAGVAVLGGAVTALVGSFI
jgi:hypothetical protein